MQNGDWINALSCYNEAVFLAPNSSETLTLAIANRAAVWIKLEEYDKAHLDLKWLLTIGKYPPDSIYKIFHQNSSQCGNFILAKTLLSRNICKFQPAH